MPEPDAWSLASLLRNEFDAYRDRGPFNPERHFAFRERPSLIEVPEGTLGWQPSTYL
jgi:hypothetical protein